MHGPELPILVVRPEGEAALESVQADLTVLEAQGHRTWVARPGVHGASMLDPTRVEESEETWRVFEDRLEEVARTPR